MFIFATEQMARTEIFNLETRGEILGEPEIHGKSLMNDWDKRK